MNKKFFILIFLFSFFTKSCFFPKGGGFTEVCSYTSEISKELGVFISYYNMLSQAQDWVPPTPEHCKLKEFMIKQLEGSLNFDCGNYEPVTETREEYIEYRLSTNRFTREIEHYRESYQKQVDAWNERREWVKQLMDSLK